MWSKVDLSSKQNVKASSNVESERVYSQIAQNYHMLLACKECIDSHPNPSEAEEHQTRCRKNKMLLSTQGGNVKWKEVHNVPKRHIPCGTLCDLGEICRHKSRCNYPHNQEECALWRILYENKWSLDALIEDMQKTDLRLKYAISHVSKGAKVLIVCKICYKNKKYDRFLKAKKKPACQNGHPWKRNQTLVMEVLGEENENRRYLEVTETLDCSSQDHLLEEIRHDAKKLKLLLNDYSFDEITQACNQCKQRKNAEGLKSKRKKKKKGTRITQEEDRGDDDEENNSTRYDTYFDDILEDVDVDSSEVEESFRKEAIENISKSDKYYELFPYEDLDELLDLDPAKYKLCSIKLDGSQKAICTVLDDGQKIEIKGRQNCGPTANGDIVVVEIKKEEVLDAEWKEKEGAKDEELHMTRGTVVGIKVQKCNRRSYNFVCTVDEYYSHLMMPICGTIPKIHCQNKPIRTEPDAVKNSKVCVYHQKGGDLQCSHIVRVNRKNIHDKLFVVKYEVWGITHIYSRGYVVKVIKPGMTLQGGQRVLDLMYQIPPAYSDSINKRLNVKFLDGIPQSLMKDREDFTGLNVFSIDPPDCQDVDDALSVNMLQKSNDSKEIYKVGIHISDVTAFLPKNDELDRKAATRKISFYPQHGSPQHMLPDKLSRNLCSLIQGETRLTISVFVHLDQAGNLMDKPEFHKGFVKNQRQFTYAEAEKIISKNTDLNVSSQMSADIRILHKLAKGLRIGRIGKQSYFKETQISFDRNHEMSDEAHMLIEEWMIFTNALVAQHLVEQLPEQTLVRSQPAPSDNSMDSWMKMNKVAVHCGFLFQDRTDEIVEYIGEKDLPNDQILNILNSSFSMLSNFKNQDFHQLENIIAMEKMHPTLAVGYSGWLNIQTRAKIHRHEDQESSRHFSLKKNYYTWFTSPIRRYMDIIIHRLLLYVMDRDKLKEMPYTAEEIDGFSRKFNHAVKRSREHSRASSVLKMASDLKNSTVIVPAFVGSFDDDSVTLELPYLPQIKKRNRCINYSLFGVCDKPELKDSHFTLLWQRRLYNTVTSTDYARPQSKVTANITTKLNHEKHVKKVLCANWQELQDLVIQQDQSELPGAIERMMDASIPHNFQDGLFDDVTSEMKDSFPIIKHHAKFSLKVETGCALPVQLGTTSEKGMLTPAVNLIELSKTIGVCTEHVSDPVKCFADIAITPGQQKYRDINEYKNIWLPILEMESATNAVLEGDPITIHNVPVNIRHVNDRYDGHLELNTDFCNHRHIKFLSTKKISEEESQDYLCLKFPFKENLGALPNMQGSFLLNHFQHQNVWVAHAHAVFASTKEEDDIVKLEFTVNQHCSPPANKVKYGKLQNCTVEFIPKTLPDR